MDKQNIRHKDLLNQINVRFYLDNAYIGRRTVEVGRVIIREDVFLGVTKQQAICEYWQQSSANKHLWLRHKPTNNWLEQLPKSARTI